MFGGILALQEVKKSSKDIGTGFEYQADMWKFNMLSNQWDQLESYGISRILRQVYLWNDTLIIQDIQSKQKLFSDMRFVEYDPALREIPLEDQALEIPRPRAGHSMTLAGEPQDYILIFGGVSNETVTADGETSVIKRTLDDLWVFYVRSSQWNRIYPNSKTNPSKREFSKMVTVRGDRAMFMFGGQYGEKIYNDLWQWNVNTNMWA